MGETILAQGNVHVYGGRCGECHAPMGRGRGGPKIFTFACTSCDAVKTCTIGADGAVSESWNLRFIGRKTA